jgi:hypothetical protein
VRCLALGCVFSGIATLVSAGPPVSNSLGSPAGALGGSPIPAIHEVPVNDWLEFATKDVVTSEPTLELFCANGRWFVRGRRHSNSGTYTLSDGKLCVSYPGGKFCRDLSRSPTGDLLASENGRNAAIVRAVAPPPNELSAADLCAGGAR